MPVQSFKENGASESSEESSAVLTRRKTRRVVVCVETDTSYGRRVIRGIANYAELNGGWHLVLDPRDFEHRSALPEGWEGDGIIARLSTRTQVERIQACNVPIVNVDDMFIGLEGVPSVINDEAALAEQAVTHLLDQGFRTFGYFAPPSTDYSKRRGEAFEAALAERGYECHTYKPGYRPGRKLSWVEQQRRVSRWLASLEKPIAILAIDAQQARQLAEICHLRSLRVPDDIAILSGDANDIMCEVS
ncbi:MAG: XylR family transcriptional regulator, partial [Planctomycetota bacterium]